MNSKAIFEMVRKNQTPTLYGAEPSLRTIAKQVRVPVSTFTRLRNGESMSGPALCRLLLWLHKQGAEWSYIMNRVTR